MKQNGCLVLFRAVSGSENFGLKARYCTAVSVFLVQVQDLGDKGLGRILHTLKP